MNRSGTNEASKGWGKLAGKPEVGAIFMYGGHLWIDGTSLDNAEPYGGFMGHGRGHDAYWQALQQAGSVPRDVEYDEVPRGRVGYDVATETYHLLLDKCILDNKVMIEKIFDLMRLPPVGTVVGPDSHYRCPVCMKPKKTPEQLRQEEGDWDF